jgi:hypothetical protein
LVPVACLTLFGIANAQSVDATMPVTNGAVYSVAVQGNVAYLGGNFSHLGPVTRGLAVFATTSEIPLANFPTVDGSVRSVVADGNGGWYVGGVFTHIGGVARSNLAHVSADGSVDAWDPGTNKNVYAIALTPTVVYVGGDFTSAGGKMRCHVACLDRTTGAATNWNASPDTTVVALATYGSSVFVGGAFTKIGIRVSPNLAFCDGATGALVPGFAPQVNGIVNAVAICPSPLAVIVGGTLTSVNSTPRNYVAALSISDGSLQAWDPNADGQVKAITVAGGTVYLGGLFHTVGGSPRNNVAAVDAMTGAVTAWAPASAIGYCNALSVQGGVIYAGGVTLQGYDTSSGAVSTWSPDPDQQVFAVASSGAYLCVGGEFDAIGGIRRNRLAAIDLTTHQVAAWDPGADGGVFQMIITGPTAYVCGGFQHVGGQARGHLAEIDLTSGQATSWAPNVGSAVPRTIAVSDSDVYVGGDFTSLGSAPDTALAAISRTSALVRDWHPGLNIYGTPGGEVHQLALEDHVLYVAGLFTGCGSQARQSLASFATATGELTAWHPTAEWDYTTYLSLAVSGGRVYTGLDNSVLLYTSGLDAFDASSGALLWRQSTGPYAYGLANGPPLYVGTGDLMFLDDATGSSTGAPLPADGDIYTIAVAGSQLYVGGDFESIGGVVHPFFAAVSRGGALDVDPKPAASPSSITLSPDPARDVTTIALSLAAPASVTVEVFDLAGRRVAVAANGQRMSAGRQTIQLPVRDWHSGVYLVRMSAEGHDTTRRLAVLH